MSDEMRILLVTCNEELVKIIREELSKSKYYIDLTISDNVKEAEEKINELYPDMVLFNKASEKDISCEQIIKLTSSIIPTPIVLLIINNNDEREILEYLGNGIEDYVLEDHLVRIKYAVEAGFEKKQLYSEKRDSHSKIKHALNKANKTMVQLAALFEGAKIILEKKNFKEIAFGLFQLCLDIIQVEDGYISICGLDSPDKYSVLFDKHGISSKVKPHLNNIAPEMMKEARAKSTGIILNTVKTSFMKSLLPNKHAKLNNMIIVPIFAENQHIGTLALANKETDFTEDDATLAFGFGDLISIALNQKKLIDSVKYSQDRYFSLVNSAQDAIISINKEKSIIFWNQEAIKMFGFSSVDIEGKSILEIVPESNKSEYVEKLNEIIELKSSLKSTEITLQNKNGVQLPAEITISSWTEKDDVFFTIIIRDITARKKEQIKYKKINKELKNTLKTIQDTKSRSLQNERLNALGQMASGIVHDFNNVLSPILGFSDILLENDEKLNDKPSLRRYLGMINTAAKDAQKMIINLRSFYKQRHSTEYLTSIDITKVLKESVELTKTKWKEEAQAKGIFVDLKTNLENNIMIQGSESEIREVFINLIINSVDALNEPGYIQLSAKQVGDRAVVIVKDDGIGMTKEVQARCFEPFFSTKGESGSGIGMAMVYGIIQRHEGTIEVTSAPGEGTTFIIKLPIFKDKSLQLNKKEEERTKMRKMLNILVVDDKELPLATVKEFLEIEGHSVTCARNGKEGLELFKSDKYDLLITDKSMPKMNGNQLAQAVNKLNPDLPIIMLTGFSDELVDGIDDLYINKILGKPINQTTLINAIYELIK